MLRSCGRGPRFLPAFTTSTLIAAFARRLFSPPRGSPQAEETFGKKTPWDSAYKLEHVARKAGRRPDLATSARTLWLLSCINDLCNNKLVSPGELSVTALTGKGRGGKGLLDLLLFKKDLLEFFLNEKLEGLGLRAGAKSAVRNAMSSVAAYRAAFGHKEALTPPDLTWFGALPPVAQHLVRLIEASLQIQIVCVSAGLPPGCYAIWPQDTVYNIRYDGPLKVAVKANRSLDEALDSEDIREALEKIESLGAEELAAQKQPAAHEAAEDATVGLPAAAADVCRLSLPQEQFEKLGSLGDDDQDVVAEHAALAARIVAENVRLLDGSDKESTITDIIRQSPVGMLRGSPEGSILIHYDVKLSGEDAHRPAYRPPALRRPHLEKLVRATLRSRLSNEAELAITPGDVFVLFDAGRPGNQNFLTGAFSTETTVGGKQRTVVFGLAPAKR